MSSEKLSSLLNTKPKYMFPEQSSQFTYTRTYSRFREDLGRRETWEETVDRYINFIKEERGDKIPPKVINKMRHYILSMGVMPSMRALWAAGPAAKADNTTMYNCSFSVIDNPEAFAECLYILMCGTGYGFGVEDIYVNSETMPVVPVITSEGLGTYKIRDEKSGWADSLKLLINSLYQGKNVDFDYSDVRKKGSKLKTMGGRSSGPEPLLKLHNFIRETFYKAQGRKLTSLECHDICNEIAEIVVVGGVRRSSQISLSDLHDIEMRNAKVFPFPPRRYMANNSAVYYEKPSAIDFLNEWASLAKSGSGERGIFNLGAARKNSPKRRNANKISGTNPSLRAGTRVWTKEYGMIPIEELEGKFFTVKGLNGNLCEAKCWLSSNNANLFKVTLKGKTEIYATAEHKWAVLDKNGYTKITTDKLEPGMKLPRLTEQDIISYKDTGSYRDGRIVGYFYGDGWITDRKDSGKRQYGVVVPNNVDRKQPYLSMFKELYDGNGCVREHGTEFNSTSEKIDSFFKKFGVDKKEKGLPEFIFREASNQFINGFIQGYFDADGHLSKDRRHSIVSKDKKLIKDFQDLLGFKGRYYNYTENHLEQYTGANGKTYIKDVNRYGLRRGLDKLGKENSVDIISIEKTNLYEPVWDISVEDSDHCFQLASAITGNCGEILLRSKQFCNLSEVVIRPEDDLDDLLEKVECATWIGAIQSTFTHFPYLSKEWKENCDEERLLGVSLTGQMDNPSLLTESALKALKARAIKVAKKASGILGINMPTAITCVKPSGTVSQLVNSSSGIHVRYAPFYIRRYRISATDPLFKMIKAQGVPLTPENGQENLPEDQVTTWVLSFVEKAPKGAITRHDVTALDQLEHYKKVQKNWCEHNASCTIYVKDDEWFLVGNWVYENWDFVGGLSFLPYDGGIYKLAPYEEITEKQYNELKAKQVVIDYSKLSDFEKEDNTEGGGTFSCIGDKCDLK